MNHVSVRFRRTVKMRPLPISGSLANSELHNVWNTAYIKTDWSMKREVPGMVVRAYLLFHDQYP